MAGSSGGAVPPDGPATMRRRTAPEIVSIRIVVADDDDAGPSRRGPTP